MNGHQNGILKKNTFDEKFTFAELYERHVTSHQLHLWSASMDVVEQYQFYLNQISTTNEISLASQVFYNCTSPSFGPFCQYSFDYNQPHYSSLNELVHDFYVINTYKPTTMTCYVHLQCNRGSKSVCLDWSEICDGIVDCIDGNDERDCWPMEIYKCKENEFQCHNGQCIPKSFTFDNTDFPDCFDGSDESWLVGATFYDKIIFEPTFVYEDVLCLWPNKLDQSLWTRSCFKQRHRLLLMALFSENVYSIPNICWSAFKCLADIPDSPNITCSAFCLNGKCDQLIREHCPSMLYMPAVPTLFGHIYFVYIKEDAKYIPRQTVKPTYICSKDDICQGFPLNSTFLPFNNLTCYLFEDIWSISNSYYGPRSKVESHFQEVYTDLYRCNTIQNRDPTICNHETMYRCANSSKCISKHRLCDRIIDCNYGEDEECDSVNGTCFIQGSTNFFHCSKDYRCISLRLVHNAYCDCAPDEDGVCDDEIRLMDYIRKYVYFPTVCDGFVDLLPVLIDGKMETDETECQHWLCNNTYTRCNGLWNCFNGADEVDCAPLRCPLGHHTCVSQKRNILTCLPIEKANDGNIDCLGATDEPQFCRGTTTADVSPNNFYCNNGTSGICMSPYHLCNTVRPQCMHGENLQFCNTIFTSVFDSMCNPFPQPNRTDVERFFCERVPDSWRDLLVYFSVNLPKYPTLFPLKRTDNMILPRTVYQHQPRCHRGLDLRVWLNIEKNLTNTTCLCPPSYYGDICQYQNQRISFTVQFSVYPDSQRTPFTIIVFLIDDSDQRTIHSFEQFTYLPIRDCQTKFNVYLLYSSRPKNRTKTYSIHIDIYEKISLKYRGSLLVPFHFPFLSVHRIATQLYIPRTRELPESCDDYQCIHGQCMKYFNDNDDSSFCRCDSGWSGRHCNISYPCSCSSGSLCLGISVNNRSICVCPIDKFGSRCLLESTVCQSNPCDNHGQCIPINEDVASEKKFQCICPRGFSGELCEIADTKIIISFQQSIILPQSMIIHFIRAMHDNQPENGTTLKTIPIVQDLITVFWSHPFHVAFVELSIDNYYLLIVQNVFNQSTIINKTINPSDRCEHISEIFNETIVNLHPLRRIKYYQLPCLRHTPQLSCFYDDIHFCFCYEFGKQRIANCFEFNLTKKLDCFGRNQCENGGKCLQDNVKCPQTSICVCPTCFYGTHCQFRSSGFGHSLDALLGYHIQPKIGLWNQSILVKISALLTILMTGAGFLNSVIGIITFRDKNLCTNGCALYLLASSIASLLTMIMFSIKFWILIIAQITPITNRIFLQFQCLTVDILLRIFLSSDQWVNAFVAIEQAITVVQGVNFNQKKSKQLAKYLILVILLFTIGTAIHEPFHRHLIDEGDEDDSRIWCIVTYSDGFQVYDSIINIFHFFVPFIINLGSAIFIIIKTIRQQTVSQNPHTYRRQIREIFQQQKHVILSPLLLVILSSPSIIIYLVSNCLKSAADSEIFLAGYFMSFSPSILTFFLFILPSKLYKEEFFQILERYKLKIRAQFRRILSRLVCTVNKKMMYPVSRLMIFTFL